MIWFVGSNPSKKNTCPLVPFEGTKSMLTLQAWFAALGIAKYGLINVSNVLTDKGKVTITPYDLSRVYTQLKGQKKVIALGNIASKALKELEIDHFKLPHPSPRNRLLNNPIYIEGELTKCEQYLASVR